MDDIHQGDIYLVDLNPIRGHEQGGVRPVLVVHNDTLTRYLNTVAVLPITSNMKAKGLMTTFFLAGDEVGLAKDSLVILSQIRTVDKKRFIKKIGHLNAKNFTELRLKLMRTFW